MLFAVLGGYKVIAYDIQIVALNAAVDVVDPNWRKNAATRTKKLLKAKKFDDQSSIWSAVKPVFIELQHRKCVFCERQLEGLEYGRIEFDIEHFRPKSSVKSWPPKGWNRQYSIPMGAESRSGYYWLAYDLLNYAASCKVCNSPLKANYFPIAGKRIKARTTAAKLKRELPYLCYPLGSQDDDPETLVTFIATTAVPAAAAGHNRLRGEVIIDFFQLNDRLQLHRERARMISLMGNALKSIAAADADAPSSRQIEKSLLHASIPHAACLRAYHRLWSGDNALARKVHAACQQYAVGMEDAKPPAF
ncbi:hypothetical protein [Bradyrhizobium sp. USDA 4504]